MIAVDHIDQDLKRIINYVNRRTGSGPGLRLVAAEFPRFQKGQVQILVTEVYGDEVVAPPLEVSHKEFWTQFRTFLESRARLTYLATPNAAIAASSATRGFVFRVQPA